MDIPYRIQLLGGLCVCAGDRPIDHFRSHAATALIAYLALHPRQRHLRERLTEQLWPETDPAVGRARLRPELSTLNRQLHVSTTWPSLLLIDRDHLRLNAAAVTIDTDEFEDGLRTAPAGPPREAAEALRRTVSLYRGELLPGRFDDWLILPRERLAQGYLNGLQRLATALADTGEIEEAIAAAHTALHQDPLQESLHLALMRLYARAGRPGAILRQAQRLRQTVQDAFHADISPPMQTWIGRLVREASQRGVGSPAATADP